MGGSCGFTLAEVLIVLGIIGLIADMTIPTLVNSYQKQITVIRLQKAYTSIAQAVKMSEIDNGPSGQWEFGSNMENSAVKAFSEKYITPYFNKVSIIDSPTYTLMLADGTTIYFRFDRGTSEAEPSVIYFDIDINGNKKPNKSGKDQFIIRLWRNNGRLDMFLWCDGAKSRECIINNSYYGCKKGITRLLNCGALIQYDGWKISDDYPW